MTDYRAIWAVLILGAFGCASTGSFVLTGEAREPRAEDAFVQPYLTGLPSAPFEEIGVVEVRGHDLEARVEKASKIARAKGGNGIILLNSNTRIEGSSFVGGSFMMPPLRPGWGYYGVAGPSSAIQSVEVDRYIVVRVAPESD